MKQRPKRGESGLRMENCKERGLRPIASLWRRSRCTPVQNRSPASKFKVAHHPEIAIPYALLRQIGIVMGRSA